MKTPLRYHSLSWSLIQGAGFLLSPRCAFSMQKLVKEQENRCVCGHGHKIEMHVFSFPPLPPDRYLWPNSKNTKLISLSQTKF